MTRYTFDDSRNLKPITSAANAHWTTNELDERVLLPMQSALESRFFTSKPYVILKSDGSVEFPRLNKTVIPDDTTLVESLPTDQRRQGRVWIGMFDLVILHHDQSYYILSGTKGESFSNQGIGRLKREITDLICPKSDAFSPKVIRQNTLGKHHAALMARSEFIQKTSSIPFGEIITIVGGFFLIFAFLCFLLTLGQPTEPLEPHQPNSVPASLVAMIFTMFGLLIVTSGLYIRRAMQRSKTKLENKLKEKYGLDEHEKI